MTTITTGDVLAYIKLQLDWRGPTGKAQGNIVINYAQAQFLHQRVLDLISTQDKHIAEIDRLKKEIDLVSK
jgi:hypothetical protein